MQHNSLLENTTFWYALAFAAFFAVAGRAVAVQITKWLDGKIEKIRAGLDEAALLRAEAEQLLAQAKIRYDAAEQEADKLVTEATLEAKAIQTRTDAETAARVARREAQATARIAQAEAQAVAAIKQHTAALALQLAKQQLAALPADTQTALADSAIAGIGKAA